MFQKTIKLVVLCIFGYINLSSAIDVAGCGSSKMCVFSSPGCSPSDASCLIFTYIWNASANSFDMELSGSTGGGNQYVAIAFSSDGLMQNSDLYYCTGNSFRSGAIAVRHMPPTIDATLPSAISNPRFATTSGVAECSFTRAASVTKPVSGGNRVFDLSTTQFAVIQAQGQFGTMLERHTPSNRFSSALLDFTATSDSSPPTQPPTSGVRTVVADGCGTTKGCFQNPVSCIPGASGCRFASWIYVPSENAFDIEIAGGLGDQYAALAFASTPTMMDADLYYCTAASLVSGVIRQLQFAPVPSPSAPDGVENVEVSSNDGSIACKFRRPASVVKIVSDGVSSNFDLVQTNYFFLYAVGPVSGSDIVYHGINRIPSSVAFDFKEVFVTEGDSSGSNTMGLFKAHACLMLIAWLTCASIGVIIARHFKPLWHDSKCIGEKVWFQLHRSLMIAVLLCTIVAFIIIFVAKKGKYSENAGAHPVIGIIVTCLVVINPVMAIFRPHPGTPKRPVFNWAHWIVGSVARILGLVAIFLGVDLTALNIPEWDTWLLVGFVVFHVLTEVLLELLSAFYGHIAVYKKPSNTEDIPMDGETRKDPPPKGATVKYVVLLVYSVVNIAILLTFIVTIGGHQ